MARRIKIKDSAIQPYLTNYEQIINDDDLRIVIRYDDLIYQGDITIENEFIHLNKIFPWRGGEQEFTDAITNIIQEAFNDYAMEKERQLLLDRILERRTT